VGRLTLRFLFGRTFQKQADAQHFKERWSATTAAPDRGRLFVRWRQLKPDGSGIVMINPLTNGYVRRGNYKRGDDGTVGSIALVSTELSLI
jgi:hypothetical protein